MNKTNFMLTIQSRTADVESLRFHYQQEPFPGGLTYSLEIREPSIVVPLAEKFGPRLHNALTRADASWIFSFVDSMLGLERIRAEPKFWANNIEQLDVREDLVRFKGICSPHVA